MPDVDPDVWPADQVLWGVQRRPGHFDIEDPRAHSGLVQHAFPPGRDWMAVCGFRPPLQRAFDSILRPLLALASPVNPRCARCAMHLRYPGPTVVVPIEAHRAAVPMGMPGPASAPMSGPMPAAPPGIPIARFAEPAWPHMDLPPGATPARHKVEHRRDVR